MKATLYVAVLFLISCNFSEDKMYQVLSAKKTGITFANNVPESDSLNYFNYAYIYMGGGVSAGDVNNDGLVDLFFTGNMVPNKLYINKGNLQFEALPEQAGISGDKRWYTGTTMVDINHDGFLDIYCSVGGKYGPKENQLFLNNGDLTFTETAASYGIADLGNSVQAVFFDYDRDGDIDLYVANYPPTPFNAPNNFYQFKQKHFKEVESDRLYRNDGNTFTDVTEESGLASFGLTLSANVGDLNEDGWPDLYISNDFSTPDYLYINNKDGSFSEHSKTSLKNTSFYGMGVDISDFNNDGLLDIFQLDMSAKNNRRAKANMASMNPALFWSTVNAGFHYQYMQNSLQLNNGNLIGSLPDFSNVSRISGVASTDWSWGPLFADLDNDGFKDLFVTNGTRREINNRDYFSALEQKKITQENFLKYSLEIPSEPIDNFVFRNEGGLTFKKINKAWGLEFVGFSNGATYADLDNDGDLEIIINNIDATATILENKNRDSNHYLDIHLKGSDKNPLALGSRVYIYTQTRQQLQELTLTRGFQSSVSPVIHFGLGKDPRIDSLKVIWPDGKTNTIYNVPANQKLVLEHSKSQEDIAVKPTNPLLLFTAINSDSILKHKHVENDYDDFKNEVLLPHKTSSFGPDIAVGDLNNDGKDDMVIGGASQSKTAIYLQTADGFKEPAVPDVLEDARHEDMGIHLFDADMDGDKDMYVVSGGNEFEADSKMLQDRLYINRGDGTFYKDEEALPEILSSGGRVKSFDYDRDGDLDLFVCGRLVPGNYPLPAKSYLLENVSRAGEIKFLDVTDTKAKEFNQLGMVTDAVWTDYNNDGWTDLFIVGEWMPLTVFKNQNGIFKNETKTFDLEDTRGWWFSIAAGDFDQDGDLDYIAGNLGENYKYKANSQETFDIYFNDFDRNNKNDIVLSYYNEGEKFPVRGRECSSQQIPSLKEKYKNYASYSVATLENIYTDKKLKQSLHYAVKSFASVYIENTGNGFKTKRLPVYAQLSAIHQILVEDYDKDGYLDALIAGNLFASEVETPRSDAGIGLFLKGNGKGGFSSVKAVESGFYAPGDVKCMKTITIANERFVVLGKNDEALQFIKINP